MAQHGGQNKREITEKEYKQLEVMAGLHLPIDQMASIMGIHRATFHRMIKRDKRLAATLENGRAKSGLKVRETAFSMASSGDNPAMTIFWLKTREGFRETERLELTGKDGKPLDAAKMSPAQRSARMAVLEKMLEVTDET